MKQFLCELLFACTLLGSGAQSVDELTYGTILYEHFQRDPQAALLKALVAEKQGRRGVNSVRFELAEGSFAFADGLYDHASATFAAIDESEIEKIDRLRLAFHLSREFHRRQDWPRLAEQLGRIQLGETWLGRQRRHPEVTYMRGELAAHRGNFELAQQQFELMEENHPLRAYGLFNLGVAYREAGQLQPAQRTFGQLARMPAQGNEAFDLTQRARLALALIARQEQKNETAESVLSSLPAEGRYQAVAMAAYAGLAMDNADYELAARIWMTLQEQDYWNPSIATARLGFPLSLERMARQGRTTTEMALAQFRQAEQSFSTRLGHLQQMAADAGDPRWIAELITIFASDSSNPERLHKVTRDWHERLGHTGWLEWLATDKVNRLLSQWRELNGMDQWLVRMPRELDALKQIATEQRRRSGQARVLLGANGLPARRAALQTRMAATRNRLQALRAAQPRKNLQWMMQLADSEERGVLHQLAEMRGVFKKVAPPDQSIWSARLNRLEGVIFYRLVDEHAKRLQVLNKEHRVLASLLAVIDAKIARVANAESEFGATVGADLTAFQVRADAITAKVKAARMQRETLLAGEIRNRLQQEMKQVEQYLLVTRIGVARTTDQLAMASAEASQ